MVFDLKILGRIPLLEFFIIFILEVTLLDQHFLHLELLPLQVGSSYTLGQINQGAGKMSQ